MKSRPGVGLRQANHAAATLGKALADAKRNAPPSESWWIGLDRVTFYAEAARRHPEMASSTEGRKFPREWRDA